MINEYLSLLEFFKEAEEKGLTIRNLRKEMEKRKMPISFRKKEVQQIVAINVLLGYLDGPVLGPHSNPMLNEKEYYKITEEGKERLMLANQRK